MLICNLREGLKSGIFSALKGLTYSWTRWHGSGTRRYVPTACGGHGQQSRHLERGRQRGGKREWAAKTSVDRNSLMEKEELRMKEVILEEKL